ncbi:MAG: phosphopantothenoylcysteine decarboxylase [Oscillospiraceae bacterium]|jgi:phosphopantothenoylcysteine decarboxylase/phosphopantothenoylcysteine decarboxylase/phosphopantothenate--cysteine ligase|nr:phosphopantothenoylcysteine decarboxylase [Oscillospiraceae bacterium]
MKNIILGVTGSIAAYKAAELANRFTKLGHRVDVIMTRSAREFVTPLTFQTLTKTKVNTDMFDEISYEDVRHISLAQRADLVLIAPATANIIGKIAGGIADDFLTTVVMAVREKPVVICPAMNTAMYDNPITRDNIGKLDELGYIFVEPRSALLACGDVGRGALAAVDDIESLVSELLTYHPQFWVDRAAGVEANFESYANK